MQRIICMFASSFSQCARTFRLLVLTRGVGDAGWWLVVLRGIGSRLGLLLRQQPHLFQQASLLPLLPLSQNHLEVKRGKKQNNNVRLHCGKTHKRKRRLRYGQLGWLAFFRAVGFLALGTSLCLPFFTSGLVESKGLWAILSCCHGGFFWAEGCFWTTGSPPPTAKKLLEMFNRLQTLLVLFLGEEWKFLKCLDIDQC